MIADLEPYPAIKDSGVEWLGEVPEHWAEKRAKYFYREVDERSTTGDEELMSVSHKTGVTPRKKSVTMFLAESNVGHKVCRPDDIAINTMWAFMGALGVAQQVGLVSPSYGVYRPVVPGVLMPDYIDRVLRIGSYKSEYMCRSTGINSSRLRLYPDEFLRIPVICPPLPEQAAIVRYLDHVDRRVRRLVRAKRKLIALLTEQKQAIIHHAVTRGLAPNVPLKDSGVEWLGEVPEHWDVLRVRRLVTRIDQGVSPQAEAILADDGWWGVLKSGCVNGGEFREYEHKRLPSDFNVDEGLAVSVGDVLISRACGSPRFVGSVGRVHELNYRLILSDKTFRPVFKDPERVGFVVRAMNSRYFRTQVELALSGAEGLANNLPLSALKGLWVALPPTGEAVEITNALDAELSGTDTAITRANREIELLNEYRTRLIADVVTGKLDVREAAAALPKVDPFDTADDVDATLDPDSDRDLDDLDSLPEAAEA